MSLSRSCVGFILLVWKLDCWGQGSKRKWKRVAYSLTLHLIAKLPLNTRGALNCHSWGSLEWTTKSLGMYWTMIARFCWADNPFISQIKSASVIHSIPFGSLPLSQLLMGVASRLPITLNSIYLPVSRQSSHIPLAGFSVVFVKQGVGGNHMNPFC